MGRDVVVVGDANLDLVLRGDVVPRFGQAEQLLDAADLALGGSGAIVAAGLARLGLDVALVAAVGADAFGDLTLDLLRTRDVALDHVVRRPEAPTGLTVVLSAGQRAILTHSGAIATLSAADVPAVVLAAARHVHSASCYLTPVLRPDLPHLLRAARGAGATTSLDTNDDPARTWEHLSDLLAAVDVVLPNDAELRLWAGVWGAGPETLEGAARLVAGRGPAVVVKAGADGGLLVTGERHHLQSASAATPVDTTGAGDSFDAGWIAARLHGEDVEAALRWAVAAGTAATAAVGGTAGQLDLAALRAAAARLP
jgi:ribokinase